MSPSEKVWTWVLCLTCSRRFHRDERTAPILLDELRCWECQRHER